MDNMVYKKIKVLLIEDNQADARLIRDLLEESDTITFEIIHTKRLLDGIIFLEDIDFDVILLDLDLPDSKGIDTLNKTKSKSKGIPIVILTGSVIQRENIRKCIDGAERYLVKGYTDSNALITNICEAIDEQSSRRLMLSRLHHAEV